MNIRKIMAGLALPALAATGLALVSPGVASAAPYTSGSVVHQVVVGQPATAAQAAQLDAMIKNDSHGCSGSEVSDNSYVHVCYVRNGDTLWVKDDEGNGRYAVGEIAGPDGANTLIGSCENHNSAASGIWVYCSFSAIDENSTAYYHGYDAKAGTAAAHFTGTQSEPTS